MQLVRQHRSLPVIPANAGTQGGLDPSIPPWAPDILRAQNSGVTVGGSAAPKEKPRKV